MPSVPFPRDRAPCPDNHDLWGGTVDWESNRADDLSAAGQRLAEMLDAEEGFDLIEAALLVSADEYPEMNLRSEADRLRNIAAEASERVAGLDNFFARLDALRRYLYEELGFRGDLHNYKDPRNCYLNDVVDRRLGIPLTLSIIHLVSARASGFDAHGVGLPGHFVLRLTRSDRSLIVDPFHRGRVISPEDCRELVRVTTGRQGLFRGELLNGARDRELIGRMLLNLKHLYVGKKDYSRALSAVERLLIVRPGNSAEIRDRGLLKAEIGRTGGAIDDLEAYLAASPSAPDFDSVRSRVRWLHRHVAQMN